MTFEPWQWLLLALGALAAGFSKTGIPGVSILFVAIFAAIMPARQATGIVLPLLIFADLFAVAMYRRHLEWGRVGRLLPWAVAGVVSGWLALGAIDDQQTRRVIGVIIAVMLALHVWRKRGRPDEAAAHAPRWVGPVAGLLAGFTTMVANAAGPVMTLYLLAMRLTKLEFIGTGAVFFLLINWIKVPFSAQLDLINAASLGVNLKLLPAVAVGALAGKWVVGRINQAWFENTALALTAVAAVRLVFF